MGTPTSPLRLLNCVRPDAARLAGQPIYQAEGRQGTHTDLRKFCPPVYNQGNLGACTGFASAKGFLPTIRNIRGLTTPEMSALYVYYYERLAERTVNSDAGATLCDAMYVLRKRGCATEMADPYVPASFTVAPTPAAEREAPQYAVRLPSRLVTHEDRLHCLSTGRPFIGGIECFRSLLGPMAARTGIVELPGWREQPQGGHAVCFVGFTTDGHFIVRNSWGADWGDQGYFYLPFAYVERHGFDFWTAEA